MKNLSEIKQLQFVTLEGLNKEDVEKLQNLDHKPINECCGCCCEPCCGEKCCGESVDKLVWFYSENEIINMLKTEPKVSNLGDLHRQFSPYRFYANDEQVPRPQQPLFFKEKMNQYNGNYIMGRHDDGAVKRFVMSIPGNDPVVMYKLENNDIQVFYVYYPETEVKTSEIDDAATSGKGFPLDIKRALISAAKVISTLERKNEVSWAQVLDVSIDNLDCKYAFLITYTLKPEFFAEQTTQKPVQQ